MQNIINTLNGYLTLDNNWDGYKGIPPKKCTVDNAIFFLSGLEDIKKLNTKIMLSSYGNVGLYWRNKILNIYVEIEFENTETNEFNYLIINNKQTFGDEDICINSIPSILKEYINKTL